MSAVSLEEVGEVPGSTHVPHHVVEQADDVHHLCLNKTLFAIIAQPWARPCSRPSPPPTAWRRGQGSPACPRGRRAEPDLQAASWQEAPTHPAKMRSERVVICKADLGLVQLPGGGHLPHHLLGAPRHAPTHQTSRRQCQRGSTWGRLRCSRLSSPCSARRWPSSSSRLPASPESPQSSTSC